MKVRCEICKAEDELDVATENLTDVVIGVCPTCRKTDEGQKMEADLRDEAWTADTPIFEPEGKKPPEEETEDP
jgi:hypothetical protein